MRTPVTRVSGTGQCEALDRSAYVMGLGTGAVDCSAVAPVKMAELARYGMTAKAPKIRALEDGRRAATPMARTHPPGDPDDREPSRPGARC